MPCGRSLQVTGRADRVGAEHPCEAICASEWDTTGEPGSGGVLCATDVEVGRAGAWCLVVPWVRVGANCTRVGWGTQRPQGGRLQRILRSPGAGLNMDPGEYSKRGLSDRLSDLLSQTIDVQPPPPFLVQDLRTFPSHFQSRALDPLVVNQLSELLRDIWEILGLEIFERSPFSRPFRSK